MIINLTEQDKAEIRFASIAADFRGENPAVVEWMAACAELPADTWTEMPPPPWREDRVTRPA